MIEFVAFSDMLCPYCDSENMHISSSDVEKLNVLSEASAGCRFIANLGGTIDGKADPEKSASLFGEVLSACRGEVPVHTIIGEHDSVIGKDAFFRIVGYSTRYRAFDVSNYRCIFLDTFAAKDGKVSFGIDAEQLGWVSRLLGKSHRPAIIFSHAPIAVSDPSLSTSLIDGSEAIRNIFEKSNKVALVIQGHAEKQDYLISNGVPYVTLAPMSKTEKATFARFSVSSSGVEIKGFGEQESFSVHNVFTHTQTSFTGKLMNFFIKNGK